MGNAKQQNQFLRAFSIALLGLILIGVGLVSDVNAADACSSQVQRATGGQYVGCVVHMGDRTFSIEPNKSSADGCAQVCGIMTEVNGGTRNNNHVVRLATTFQE